MKLSKTQIMIWAGMGLGGGNVSAFMAGFVYTSDHFGGMFLILLASVSIACGAFLAYILGRELGAKA